MFSKVKFSQQNCVSKVVSIQYWMVNILYKGQRELLAQCVMGGRGGGWKDKPLYGVKGHAPELQPLPGSEVEFLLAGRETQVFAQVQDLSVIWAHLQGGGQDKPVIKVDPQADTFGPHMKAQFPGDLGEYLSS